MTSSPEIVIVGAGPYGLSIAAHLRARGISYRIFGSPMSTWQNHMPKGMFLKSEGLASNLWEPHSRFTFKDYCQENKVPYHDTRIPVALDAFTAYGHAFQARYVPELENKQVIGVEKDSDGFRVTLDTGEFVRTRRVVLAVGITHFQHVPQPLEHLPAELLTHSSAHADLQDFSGKDVTIVGSGAGAMDLAALLHEGGAGVTVVARAASIEFHNPPEPGNRSLWQRVRYPHSGIGRGLQSKLYAGVPHLFHYLPEKVRTAIVRRHLGPAASWTVKERVVGRIPLLVGHRAQKAEIRDRRAHLTLIDNEGVQKTHVTEHIIAATGYRVDLRRLTFLSEQIQSQLVSVKHAPVLSPDFQSTVPGLYFVGLAAANTFGPVLRFTFGAEFAARQISRHLYESLPKALFQINQSLSSRDNSRQTSLRA